MRDTVAKMAANGDDETKALMRALISETQKSRIANERLEKLFRGMTDDGRSLNTATAA